MTTDGASGPRGVRSFGVAVTRGEGRDGPLSRLLEDRGATVKDWGTIGFGAPGDPAPFGEALQRLREFHWICFSSPRAVDAVGRQVDELPEGMRVAAVGPSTAKALLARGWPVDRYPEEGSGAGLVALFREADDVRGRRVFFPASEIAREVIPLGLADLGAAVHQVAAYRMVTLPLNPEACRRDVDQGEVQAVTFASPSAMDGLRTALGEALFAELAETIPAAAMGETTAAALRAAGWQQVVVADHPTLDGLADAAVRASRLRPEDGRLMNDSN